VIRWIMDLSSRRRLRGRGMHATLLLSAVFVLQTAELWHR
jgi:hypothetical protein